MGPENQNPSDQVMDASDESRAHQHEARVLSGPDEDEQDESGYGGIVRDWADPLRQ